MPLRLGPVLLCLGVAVYRAVWLSVHLSGFQIREFCYLLLADLPVLGILGMLAFVERRLARSWKVVPVILSIVLVAFYLADALAVLTLNARLQLADLRQFAGEWWIARSFVTFSSVTLVGVAAACWFVRVRVPDRAGQILGVTALASLLLPLAVPERAIPTALQKYTGSVLLLGKEAWGSRTQAVPHYNAADFAAYQHEYEALFDAPFARSRRNIILLIVESLSAVDSRRTSGIRNLLHRLDLLSREGMLFRNFFSNFEASEGGIVALLSGVPPLHFPTASTNTFAEYAEQRSITDTFRRRGYHCEFLTAVPLQFISMDAYARSPIVGFTQAAGQHEIARYKDAPRYGFESPADHVLYEEVLGRLDAAQREDRQPVFFSVITASSHPPYVDPFGRGHTEENAWRYVQDEILWLHDQLKARRFYDNGVLLITGDHRKMLPVGQTERERYGESAKARIPLTIIGAGVPSDVVDDRVFQQADLLRMLDRAVLPGLSLSPFVLWVERYVFVFGVASNAGNVEVFDASNQAREGFRLRLRGARVEWINRAPNALAVERAVHRQRALQQAGRAMRVGHAPLRFGRDLEPEGQTRGVLVGLSTDLDLTRDPDDPRGSLRLIPVPELDLENVLSEAGEWQEPFTLTARAFLSIPEDGEYWFSVFADDASCLAIDKQTVLGCQSGLNEGLALLTAGVHRFDLRFIDRGRDRALRLKWLVPGAAGFTAVPHDALILPKVSSPHSK